MPLASPDLDAAFEACRRETAEWAKTFYIGTLLLPPEKRRAIWAIYVWCRRTDELMDSPEAQARPVEELAERLDRWEEKTRALFEGRVEDDLDAVMVDTLERFPQGIQPYLDMIEGQRMDLTWTRYPRFEDLKLYCYRVAGTVGLMTQGVMGVDQAYTSAPGATVRTPPMPPSPWGSPTNSPTSFGMLGKIGAVVVFICPRKISSVSAIPRKS